MTLTSPVSAFQSAPPAASSAFAGIRARRLCRFDARAYNDHPVHDHPVHDLDARALLLSAGAAPELDVPGAV